MQHHPTVADLFSDDFPGVDAYSWTDEERDALFKAVGLTVLALGLADIDQYPDSEYDDNTVRLQDWQRQVGDDAKREVIDAMKGHRLWAS